MSLYKPSDSMQFMDGKMHGMHYLINKITTLLNCDNLISLDVDREWSQSYLMYSTDIEE